MLVLLRYGSVVWWCDDCLVPSRDSQQLSTLSADKLVRLQADEQRETLKESLRHDYAHAAQAMEGFVKVSVLPVFRPASTHYRLIGQHYLCDGQANVQG
jgi:hypothetical protein